MRKYQSNHQQKVRNLLARASLFAGAALLAGTANAQSEPDMVWLEDGVPGLESWRELADGRLELTLDNGTVLTLDEGQFWRTEDGIYIDPRALDVSSESMPQPGAEADQSADSASETSGGGGGGAGLILGAVLLGGIGAAAGGGGGGGGGGGSNTPSPSPTPTPPSNQSPSFTSGTTSSFAENGTGTAYDANATDGDGDTLTYSISGGADSALFSIDAATGIVTFNTSPDFENPGDANGDNDYVITIAVSDGTISVSQTVTITVTDVNEGTSNAPVITSASAVTITEDQLGVMTVTATASAPVIYSIDGLDAGNFTIDATTGVLRFASARDFESPSDRDADNVYELTVIATSNGVQTRQLIAVTVEDTNDNDPDILSGATSTVSEGQTSAYSTRFFDPDEANAFSFTLSGTDAALFEVNSETGEVRFRVAPDFEAPSDANGDGVYDFTLTVDDGQASQTQAVSVTVINAPESGDIPGSATTPFQMVSGGSFVGQLETVGDKDWIAIELDAGQRYSISLTGTGANELFDPLVRLFNASGTEVAMNDDISLGRELDSRLEFTAPYTGTYYIAADSFSSETQPASTGEYTIEVQQVDPLRFYTPEEIGEYLNESGWGGARWDTGVGGFLTVDITGLNTDGQRLARLAMEVWTDATGIDFREVSSGGQITFDDNEDDAFAAINNIDSNNFITSARVNIGLNWLDTYGTSTDSYSFQTYVHEIGHALGLGHAGPYEGSADYGLDEIYLNDSWQLTVMSYFSQTENTEINADFAFILTPQLGDLAAVHAVYGTPTNVRSGDTIYGFNSNAGSVYTAGVFGQPVSYTIFDTGGTDTLDFSSATQNQRFDLRAGHASDLLGVSGNILIGANVVIEQAIGGSGNDIFIGNDADNRLLGNGGNDTFYGSGGNDRLEGGAGSDTVIFSGAAGDYTTFVNGAGNTVVRDIRVGSPDGDTELVSVETILYEGVLPTSDPSVVGDRNDGHHEDHHEHHHEHVVGERFVYEHLSPEELVAAGLADGSIDELEGVRVLTSDDRVPAIADLDQADLDGLMADAESVAPPESAPVSFQPLTDGPGRMMPGDIARLDLGAEQQRPVFMDLDGLDEDQPVSMPDSPEGY